MEFRHAVPASYICPARCTRSLAEELRKATRGRIQSASLDKICEAPVPITPLSRRKPAALCGFRGLARALGQDHLQTVASHSFQQSISSRSPLLRQVTYRALSFILAQT